MYKEIRNATRNTENKRIIIDEVNTQQFHIVGRDSHDAKLRVSFDLQNPLVSIPAPGEMWSINRSSTGEWLLDKKLESGGELHPIDALAPGDRRIETSGIIYLQGEDVVINGTLFSELMGEEGPDLSPFVTIDTTQTITGRKSFTDSANFYNGLWSSRAVYDDTALATYITGDLAARMRVRADGTVVWGDGLGAIDTNLYRLAPGILATDSQFYLNGSTPYFVIRPTGSVHAKFFIDFNGVHHWGDGSGAQDTLLYRWGPSSLRTDDDFTANFLQVWPVTPGDGWAIATHIDGDSDRRLLIFRSGTLIWGDGTAAQDTNLYRAGPNLLKTDGNLHAGASLSAGGNIEIGPNNGAFIHRSNVGPYPVLVAKLAGDVHDRFSFDNSGGMLWGPGNAVADTNLYRAGANILKTDDAFEIARSGSAGSQIAFHIFAASDSLSRLQINNDGTLYFGDGTNAHDTILTRTAANELSMASGDTFKLSGAGLKFSDNSVQTTAAVSNAPGYGTAFPGSPTDGQEYILVNSTTNPTYQWRFRYNNSNSTSYKWEFIGGAPLTAEHGNFESESFATSTLTLTSFSSTFTMTLPRAGVYLMEWGCLSQVSTNAELVYMALTGNVSSSESAQGGGYNQGQFWINRGKKYTYASANQTIQPYFATQGGTQGFAKHGFIKATPIRCS